MLKIAPLVMVAAPVFAQCPVEVQKVVPAETQSWARVGRAAAKGNKGADMAPDFVVKLTNTSPKQIRGMKILAAYYDATEDVHTIPVAWNKKIDIAVGQQKTLKWENFEWYDKAYIGWVVVPSKILFEDGTKWTYDPSLRGCYGEYWHDKKRPRLTGLPDELLKKALEDKSE
jgi:hypothetical protein